MMNPTPVTPSYSSCVFGSHTGCVDGEFMLSAFTGTNMSSSVSSSDSDDSAKGVNVIDPPSSTWFLKYKVILQHVGDEALQLYLVQWWISQNSCMTARRNTHIILAYVDAVIILLLFLVLMNPLVLNPEKLLFQAIMIWHWVKQLHAVVQLIVKWGALLCSC